MVSERITNTTLQFNTHSTSIGIVGTYIFTIWHPADRVSSSASRTGVGTWTATELTEFLRQGRGAKVSTFQVHLRPYAIQHIRRTELPSTTSQDDLHSYSTRSILDVFDIHLQPSHRLSNSSTAVCGSVGDLENWKWNASGPCVVELLEASASAQLYHLSLLRVLHTFHRRRAALPLERPESKRIPRHFRIVPHDSAIPAGARSL